MQEVIHCLDTSETITEVLRMVKAAFLECPVSLGPEGVHTLHTWEVPLHGVDVNSLVSNLPFLGSHGQARLL